MAARKNRINSESARQKIRASHLILRLQKHIDGKLDPPLTMSQVRAIDILLRKIVPDLLQTQVTSEHTHRYVVEVPPLLTRDEWQKKYRVTRQAEPKTLDLKPMPLLTTTKQ